MLIYICIKHDSCSNIKNKLRTKYILLFFKDYMYSEQCTGLIHQNAHIFMYSLNQKAFNLIPGNSYQKTETWKVHYSYIRSRESFWNERKRAHLPKNAKQKTSYFLLYIIDSCFIWYLYFYTKDFLWRRCPFAWKLYNL